MSENYEINYTTINHNARTQLGITCIEYVFLDLVCNLSKDPRFDNWCFASKTKLAKMSNISEQHVHRLINKFSSGKYTVKGKELTCPILLEKDTKTKNIRTTAQWYETVVIKKGLITKYREDRKVSQNKPQQARNDASSYSQRVDENGKLNGIAKPKEDKRNPDITELQAYFLETMGIAVDNCTLEKSRQNFSNFLRTNWNNLLEGTHIQNIKKEDNTLKSNKELTKMLILFASILDKDRYSGIHIKGSTNLWFERANILKAMTAGQQNNNTRKIAGFPRKETGGTNGY